MLLQRRQQRSGSRGSTQRPDQQLKPGPAPLRLLTSLPPLLLVAGQYRLLLPLAVDGVWWAVVWSHLCWTLPYLLLTLAPAYRAGRLQPLLQANLAELLPLADYRAWLTQLPEAVQEEVARVRQVVSDLHAELPRWELVVWTAGNVSQRIRCADQVGEDLFVIKPSGVSYDDLGPEQMVVCTLDGAKIVDGTPDKLQPSSDTAAPGSHNSRPFSARKRANSMRCQCW